jgi:hypothetical protein
MLRDIRELADQQEAYADELRRRWGGLLSYRQSGHMSDLEAVPNPVIHSCQILDPGRDVRRIEIVSEELKVGRQMGYSRAKIVDDGLAKMEVDPIGVVDSPELSADAAGRLAGTDALQGLSVHVMFLARGKVGPFRVGMEAMAGRDGTHDEGADDKAITAGSYVFAASR